MGIRFTFMAVCTVVAGIAYVSAILFFKMNVASSLVSEMLNGIEVGVILCIVAAGIGWHYAQTIRRRLYQIEEATAIIAGGRLYHRVKNCGERDEIDRLGIGFNEMGEKLERQVTLLQRLADENQRLAQDAQKAATMEERQRLARDLHDSVSQELFALSMLAQTSIRLCQANSPKLEATLTQIADLATKAQREMRALLLHLRPVELKGRSFQEAAQSFLAAVEQRHGLVCTFVCSISDSLPISVEEQMFRILQEAVANVLKHANASSTRIRLLQNRDTYELTVADDGIGIVNAKTESGDTYGLGAMHERAMRIGGQIELVPLNPGTAVRVMIPRAGFGGETNDSGIHC